MRPAAHWCIVGVSALPLSDDPLVQKPPPAPAEEAQEDPKSNPEQAPEAEEDAMNSESTGEANKKEVRLLAAVLCWLCMCGRVVRCCAVLCCAAAQALAEKELGNTAYKAKQFETALQHYDRALALDPSNVAVYTNKAAVYFEQQSWEQCLELCDQAVEVGREHRVDYKLIAK